MESLTVWRELLRARRERRRQRAQLRRELMGYRTPAERQELQDICKRYGTTVEDLLAGREQLVTPPQGNAWDEAWNDIVLRLTTGED